MIHVPDDGCPDWRGFYTEVTIFALLWVIATGRAVTHAFALQSNFDGYYDPVKAALEQALKDFWHWSWEVMHRVY